MARSRQNPLKMQLMVSSSEEESEQEAYNISSPPSVPKKPENSLHFSSEAEADDAEVESESQSEPEPETGTPVRNVKPIATEQGTRKPPSEQPVKPYKLRKKDSAVEKSGEGSKKLFFKRVWNDNDELVLLQGMLDYAAEKGKNPYSDFDGFIDFIKKYVQFDFSKTQLRDKLRKLKRKYTNLIGRVRDGDEISLKVHEQKCYSLSEKIWGNEVTVVLHTASKSKVTVSKSKATAKESETAPIEIDSGTTMVDMKLNDDNMTQFILKESMRLRNGQDKAAMEAKWKQHREAHMKLYLEHIALLRELGEFVLQCYNS